jgi:DNA repair photolyase
MEGAMADKTGKPVSGTKEWASSNHNIQLGCMHDCLYCYAKAQAIRFDRATAGSWATEEILPDKVAKNFGKRRGTIMYPTTHDITPGNLPDSVVVLKRMLEAGNRVLVVSKPRMACIQTLCAELEPYKDQVLFRFTIGAFEDCILRFWEPGAPGYAERVASLGHAWASGFGTSISMEPLLERREEEVVKAVRFFTPMVTDAIWIGKANRLVERLRRNGQWDNEDIAWADRLMSSQTDERIRSLYERLKDHPKVRWKESIKAVVGLEIPTEKGVDQ